MASVKVTTNNIFASLNDDSDNETPVVKKAPTKGTTVAVTTAVAADTKPAAAGVRGARGPRRDGADNADTAPRKDNTQRPKFTREGQKEKGVSAEAHPQDRKSGNGVAPFEKRFRKDGAGRGNYGTVKSEVEAVKTEGENVEKAVEVVAPVEPEEPVVVDNTITVEEYFRNLGVTGYATEVAKVERPLNLEELKREKLQVVTSRNDKVIDVGLTKANKKNKAYVNPTYLLGCNTENSELLGVKTGHVLGKYTVKMEGNQVVGEEKFATATSAPAQRDNRPAPRQNNPKTIKKALTQSESDFPVLA